MMMSYKKRPLLDHGYIQTIQVWGSDQQIVECARMSTDKGFLGWGSGKLVPKKDPNTGEVARTQDVGDERLLKYLWNNRHLTPFEHAGITFEIKAPIFVFREWHRHRTQSYNEQSARYTPMPNENYVPSLGRIQDGYRRAAEKNKQAGAHKVMPFSLHDTADWLSQVQAAYDMLEKVYRQGLDIGMPKELARIVIPVGRYSKMRASANLRNWLAFLDLRDHPDAQEEIRVFARCVLDEIALSFPRVALIYMEAQ